MVNAKQNVGLRRLVGQVRRVLERIGALEHGNGPSLLRKLCAAHIGNGGQVQWTNHLLNATDGEDLQWTFQCAMRLEQNWKLRSE